MTALVMANPGQLGGGDHTVFVCGDHPEAKALVTGILRELGWRDVLDLGDLTAARATEMVLPIWLRLMGALQTPMFNFKVVR
jgi:8-hydroxy-5-deazaflavin:NADPH oxidoreductase